MEEHGTVIETKGQLVVIKAQRTSACDSCSSKKSCGSGGSDEEMLIEADNSIGAMVGDKVIFSVSARSVLKAGMLLYLFPILSFIAGVALGQSVFSGIFPMYNADLVSGLTGAAFLAVAFGVLKALSKLSERGGSLRPRVLKIE
ncbi:MAG TPA: hypothetical protein DDW94_02580 [Deltaproteobacteria bacterium]|nr:hypothetical protein [Deltaproteobacteria bacterium]HCY09729.1 hypothetical protein [Deltaproteobacteria bacterium]